MRTVPAAILGALALAACGSAPVPTGAPVPGVAAAADAPADAAAKDALVAEEARRAQAAGEERALTPDERAIAERLRERERELERLRQLFERKPLPRGDRADDPTPVPGGGARGARGADGEVRLPADPYAQHR